MTSLRHLYTAYAQLPREAPLNANVVRSFYRIATLLIQSLIHHMSGRPRGETLVRALTTCAPTRNRQITSLKREA